MSIIRERTNQKFREEYEKLNARQQLAVDTIEGPVMVIARSGNRKNTNSCSKNWEDIIGYRCLTRKYFMSYLYRCRRNGYAQKIAWQFIGSERAYKVNIYTFHAFCNDLIQENLSLFEKTSLDAISELERIELFKLLIDAFPKNHLLKRYRGDVYYEISNLKNLFSLMKREGSLRQRIHQSKKLTSI